MTGKTHFAAGTSIGLFFSLHNNLSPTATIAVTVCSAVASLIPDVDNMPSKLGRRLAPASFLIQLFIGHRTLFHAPILYLALSLVITSMVSEPPLLTACGLGIASHLLLDMFNSAGIPLFWPLRKRVRVANFRSGGLMDFILCRLFWAVSAALVLVMIRNLFR